MSRNERGVREVPDPFAPGRLRSGLSPQRPFRNAQVPRKTRCRLPNGRVVLTSWRCVSLHPSAWKLVAYGGFSREENIIILEARSILCAVRCAESKSSLGCLLITTSHPFQSCIGSLRLVGVCFVLSFRWIPSGVDPSDKRSRFFHRDHDPSKSHLHVIAQRLPRFPHAQTGDK